MTDDHPVCVVSWEDSDKFCRWLGPRFRLPTEAELSWAARGGSGADKLERRSPEALAAGWHRENLHRLANGRGSLAGAAVPAVWHRDHVIQPQPVGRLKPNPWGLHDTFGNVAEWCQDWLDPLPPGTHDDWAGPPRSSLGARTFFGQHYLADGFRYRFDLFRSGAEPAAGLAHVGFRVAREVG
jgi:formylglycine-generating enzyme required for sulfatase activity